MRTIITTINGGNGEHDEEEEPREGKKSARQGHFNYSDIGMKMRFLLQVLPLLPSVARSYCAVLCNSASLHLSSSNSGVRGASQTLMTMVIKLAEASGTLQLVLRYVREVGVSKIKERVFLVARLSEVLNKTTSTETPLPTD